MQSASNHGINISTFSEEAAKGSAFLREVYELVQDCWADVPLAVPYARVSFEQWEEKKLKNPSLVREGFFIALDGQHPAGYSNVWRMKKEPKTLYQAMTGVRREYRGRGVGMALKLRVIDFGRQNGYDVIKTWNDSSNAPMPGINTKLGFKRGVGWITMEKGPKVAKPFHRLAIPLGQTFTSCKTTEPVVPPEPSVRNPDLTMSAKLQPPVCVKSLAGCFAPN